MRVVGSLVGDTVSVRAERIDAYVVRLRAPGASSPHVDESKTEEERAALRAYWGELAGTVALRPVAVAEVIVRPRYIEGRESPAPDLGARSEIVAPARYGLSPDPVRSKLTIYEVATPVSYEYGDARGLVWWGLWFARDDRRNGAWVVYRSVIYDPGQIGANIVPTF